MNIHNIDSQMIKRAQRFAKVYAWIHVPLVKKPMTQEIATNRDRRAAKLWGQIFGVNPGLWREVRRAKALTTAQVPA